MPTDTVDPSDVSAQTSTEVDPPDSEELNPEELKQKLATAEQEAKIAEGEAKRWRDRANKASERSKKDDYVTREELWERENSDRIQLVETEYKEILEKGYQGRKITDKLIALELAEKVAKVSTSDVRRQRIESISVPSITHREPSNDVELTDYDRKLGITVERKKELAQKYPELKRMLGR